MRCSETVAAKSVAIRARTSPTDPGCRRLAKVNGMCLQHASLKWCQHPGCDRRATYQEGDWWFCARHRRSWAVHNRIVERILQIPPRP